MSSHFSDLKPQGTPAAPIPLAPKLPVPNFSDISKSSNDLINKDFYHINAAALEVKLKAPSGVSFTTKGTSTHDSAISSSVEAKKVLSQGMRLRHFTVVAPYSLKTRHALICSYIPGLWPDRPPGMMYKLMYAVKGISITSSWATPADALTNKVELDNTIAQGLKAEVQSLFKPAKGPGAQKLNLTFKQPNFHLRSFFDFVPGGNVTAVVDGVVAHEGFVVGGEVGYDVQKAALSRYSAALGYTTPAITAAVTATNNLSIFTASYYQKVNSAVEVGTKAAYDVKSSSTIGLEVASKYKLDPLSFAKAKINDRGIASLAYNTRVNQGFTLGVGASFDTQKLNEAGHKIGASFTFEG